MATITVAERPNNRHFTLANNAREYIVSAKNADGTYAAITEAQAWAAMVGSAPASVSGAPLQWDKCFVDEIATNIYLGHLEWIYGQAQAGSFQISFDISGQTQKITQSLQTVSSVTRPNFQQYDFHGAINANEDGSVDGVDLVIPYMTFDLSYAMSPGMITDTYPLATGYEWQYRITDSVMDASDNGERLIRLPNTYAFAPNAEAGDVQPCPSLSRDGYITFGSLNRSCKITPAIAEAWGRILKRVPNSVLVVQCDGGEQTASMRSYLEQYIDADRLLLVPTCSQADFTKLINGIDVHLDTSPYSGMTTTCDLLWQGVPTVALAGDSPHSRMSASINTACGLRGLIATSLDEYEKIAIALATGNLGPGREDIRLTARERMQALTDGKPVALAMEAEFKRLLETIAPAKAEPQQPLDETPAAAEPKKSGGCGCSRSRRQVSSK